MNINNHEIGWNFDNSYLNLPEIFFSKINPVKVSSPELIIFNEKLSNDLNLDFKSNSNIEIAKIFSTQDSSTFVNGILDAIYNEAYMNNIKEQKT